VVFSEMFMFLKIFEKEPFWNSFFLLGFY